MINNNNEYVGKELELFKNAHNWKKYFCSKIKPFIKGHVLEVGAGIGGSTSILAKAVNYTSWTCLEPDLSLLAVLKEEIKKGELPSDIVADSKFTYELNSKEHYDTIIYIDVIEHIEKDNEELEIARTLLKKGGNLIILVPAFQTVYSDFDKAIGHFRRYNKSLLAGKIPDLMNNKKIFYLDSVGLIASFVNKLFLKQKYPTSAQISFWDVIIVRFSKVSDIFLGGLFGKSLVGIWTKMI